jgi:ribonuclease P/MRP protein subunit RPP40
MDIGGGHGGFTEAFCPMQESGQNGTDVLGQLARGIHNRDRNIFLRLYQQYVRPHLEFASPAWSPWQEGDKECLEKVQRRAVGMIAGLKSRDYSERLKELGLTTMEERRHKLDMVQARL